MNSRRLRPCSDRDSARIKLILGEFIGPHYCYPIGPCWEVINAAPCPIATNAGHYSPFILLIHRMILFLNAI
jgi:hypothetical protein